jgi:tRNA A37 threonylcarbamoyladenosine synthetase subunit TsaC/SUA5/YrdC
MTPPTRVALGKKKEPLGAIEAGEVIALPSGGGYCVASALDSFDALVRLGALGSSSKVFPGYLMVGLRSQAVDLASTWSPEAGLLTDRMWPGDLMVVVPARHDPVPFEESARITMPTVRALRALCREAGPLAVRPLLGSYGVPVIDPDEVVAWCANHDVALMVDGGICQGPGPTVVDCTVSPPAVRHVGSLPESYVDAALMMAFRRRRRFLRKPDPQPPLR